MIEHFLLGRDLALLTYTMNPPWLVRELDEIEARIDRKLEEIDKRLGEWRDKEIANRIRILKITLWASAIVSVISLAYAYLTRSFM